MVAFFLYVFGVVQLLCGCGEFQSGAELCILSLSLQQMYCSFLRTLQLHFYYSKNKQLALFIVLLMEYRNVLNATLSEPAIPY